MSTGDWEERGATVVFNPGQHFRKTAKGKHLPNDSKLALIIDSSERIIACRKVEGVERLHWLVPIQPTTVQDIESNRISSHNTHFAANMMRRLDEISDAPTVEDYAAKVQSLQGQIEEAHFLHSQLFGASQDDVKALIASAYEALASIPSTSNYERSGYNSLDTSLPHHFVAMASEEVCSRCRGFDHGADTCINACYSCSAHSGHTASCDMASARPPSKLAVLKEAEVSAIDTPMHEHDTPTMFTPCLDTEALARACS